MVRGGMGVVCCAVPSLCCLGSSQTPGLKALSRLNLPNKNYFCKLQYFSNSYFLVPHQSRLKHTEKKI